MLDFVLLSFALIAGASAFLNPCGFAVLISYITNYFTKKTKKIRFARNFFNGILAGTIATTGFIFIFLTLGFTITSISRDIGSYIPLVNFFLGILLIGIGALVYTNRVPGFHIPIRTNPILINNFSFFEYGIVYALASLGCTLPIFLSVVSIAITVTFFDGILAFLAYSIGMGLIMIGITAAVATSREAVIDKIYKFMPHMKKINALILVLVGIYLIQFQIRYGGVLKFFGIGL